MKAAAGRAFGREIRYELAVTRVQDLASSYPVKNLTPTKLAGILASADSGDVAQLMDLADDIRERDAHLAGVLQTRILAVAGAGFELQPGKGRSGQKVADACDEMLRGIANWDEALLDQLDAIYRGFAASEIMWDTSGGEAWPTELRWRHQKRFKYNTVYRDIPLGQLRLLTDVEPARGEALRPNKWVVHSPRTVGGWPHRAGLIRALSWMFLLKGIALKDWAVFAEVFGMPLRMGKYDPGTPKEEIQALKTGLRSLGSDAVAVIAKSTEIALVEHKGAGGDKVYKVFWDTLNAEMSKAVLGQTLTTEIGERGSYAASQTHNEVRQDLKAADARALARTLRRDLLTPFVRFNFGEDAPVPEVHFFVEPKADQKAAADLVKTLVEAGAEVPQSYVRNTFNIPEPEPGEGLLIPWQHRQGQGEPGPGGPGGGLPGGWPVGGRAGRATPRRSSFRNAAVGGRPRWADPAAEDAEELVISALERAHPVWEEYLAPVAEAIREAADYEDLRQRLEAVGLDHGQVADLLNRAKITAHVLGQAQVEEEAGRALFPVLGSSLEPMPPEDALRWLRTKTTVPVSSFREAQGRIETKAFEMAGQEDAHVLDAVRGQIEAAVREGKSFAEFRKDLRGLYDRIGVSEMSPWHTETVFRNNVFQSFGAARYQQMSDPDVVALRPYWLYKTVGDADVRPSHRALDGMVYPAGHDFWQTYYPPNGHRCRCVVRTLSHREVERDGYTVHEAVPSDLPKPDPGWDTNPAEAEGTPGSRPRPAPALPFTPKGNVSAAYDNDVRAAEARVPHRITDRLRSRGVSVVVGENVQAVDPSLAALHPSGWPQWATFEQVDGWYYDKKVTVVENIKTRSGQTAKARPAARLLGHEIGHAVNRDFGDRWISESKAFRKFYQAEAQAVTDPTELKDLDYVLQPGTVGADEAFAEAFGLVTNNEVTGSATFRTAFEARFPKTIDYVRKWVDNMR